MTILPDSHPEHRLLAKGLALPTITPPVAAYVPTKRVGALLYVSGQLPMRSGTLIATGRVPTNVPLELAQECARQCALNALAAIKASITDLARVKQVVRVGVFVCSDPTFTDQPKVANGASQLFVDAFGDAGKHARAAVGNIVLPLGAPVEVEVLVEVE